MGSIYTDIRGCVQVLSAISAAWTLFLLVKSGLGMASSNSRSKEEAVDRFKWVIIGAVVSLSTYFLADIIGLLAGAGGAANTAMPITSTDGTTAAPTSITLPGSQAASGNPIVAWVIDAVTASIDSIIDQVSAVIWTFSGGTSQTGMVYSAILGNPTLVNGKPLNSNTNILGIFTPSTWSAMMYIQHSLMWIVGLGVLISFIVQGMQIQSSPSSGIAKERLVDMVKTVLVTALVMALTPELINWITLFMSDACYWVTHAIRQHSAKIGTTGQPISFASVLYSLTPINIQELWHVKVTSNLEFVNSLFRLLYVTVNLLSYILYLWRRVFLALWITFLPLFYIGLVTGRNKTLIIHWWKEFLAYLFIPFVAALFLYASFVFIGI